MKVGVVGLGSMGRVHQRVYSESPGVEVVGVMDPNPEKLREVGTQVWGFRSIRSWRPSWTPPWTR